MDRTETLTVTGQDPRSSRLATYHVWTFRLGLLYHQDSRVKKMLGFIGSVLVVGLAMFFGNIYITSRTRSYQLERQDMSPEEGGYALEEYASMVEMLAHMNKVDPFGYNATLTKFELLEPPPGRILEVGFGRGDFSILLARRYPSAEVTGMDAHELSVKSAREYYDSLPTDQKPPNVKFEYRAAAALEIAENSVDVITTTLVNHHIFPDEEFDEFLRRVKINARRAFIFNDVYRSFSCYAKSYLMAEAVRYAGVESVLKPLKILHNIFPSSKHFAHGLVFEEVLASVPPGMELILDGAILSTARAFTLVELFEAFDRAGYNRETINCSTSEEIPLAPCRLSCIVRFD